MNNSSTVGIGKSVGLLATFFLETSLFTPKVSAISLEESINLASPARTTHIIAEMQQVEGMPGLVVLKVF